MGQVGPHFSSSGVGWVWVNVKRIIKWNYKLVAAGAEHVHVESQFLSMSSSRIAANFCRLKRLLAKYLLVS